ncbi:MAG: hypothetical protein LRY73_00885 [Bacillus sp. (in: Bacteria)]|nr:hypothetical protein [Bacillus sp. (in: firmicutes)]
MKYLEGITRILDLLRVCVKLDKRDQEIIGKEIEGYLERLPLLDKEGITPEIEKPLLNVVDLYTQYLNAYPGDRIVLGDELDCELEKIKELMEKGNFNER